MNTLRAGAVTAATIAGVAGVLILQPGEVTPPTSVEAPSDTAREGGTAAAPSPSLATYTGEVYTTPYGPMQVEATIENGVIVDISWLSLPSDPKSRGINDRAAPQLVEEALAAQSAQVDTISGATWTSEGFRFSLQSILEQAGL